MSTPNCKNRGTINLPSPDFMPRSALRNKPVWRRSDFWSLGKPLHQTKCGSAADRFLQLVFVQAFLAAQLMWYQRALSHISTCSSECDRDYFFSSCKDQTLRASGASQSHQGIISCCLLQALNEVEKEGKHFSVLQKWQREQLSHVPKGSYCKDWFGAISQPQVWVGF